MNYYKLQVSYDGTDFCGWQSQKNLKTVQCTIKAAFLRAFHRPCKIFGASRTDTGVHAKSQIILLKAEMNLDPERLEWVLNGSLPDSVKVKNVATVDASFNPHAKIDHKVYVYRFFLTKPDPQIARFGWAPPAPEKVDWVKFQDCVKVFEGHHQFLPFCRLEPGEERQTKRSIDSVTCSWSGSTELIVTIKAHSFLRYQIRRMIGAAFEVARKKSFDTSVLKHSLKTGTSLPPQIAFNAAAKGLCLEQIVYKKDSVEKI